MAAYRDWVVETSSTTGTGTYNLSGSAPAGTSYFTFRQRFSNGEDEVVYWVVNADRTKWEKNRGGTLTYGTPDTLTRNVVESTNGDAPVPWVAGDLPLKLYVAQDADAAEFAIGMGLGTSRPAALKFGIWADQDDVSSGIHTLKLFDGTNDVPIGRIDTVQHKFMPFGFETGMVMPLMGSTAPDGWILHTTTTIGSAASGATRADADTLDLYTKLWTDFADAQAPVSGGRGASAAADFAANKTLTIPDLKARMIVGLDPSAATGRVTTAVSGVASQTIGAVGGDQALQSHNHNAARLAGGANTAGGGSFGILDPGATTSTGAGGAQNMPPAIVLYYIIKL